MNTGIERRPFKVLRPAKHSTSMVIARYANRGTVGNSAAAAREPQLQGDLLWKALRLGSLCAACAFAFFVLSERNLFHRIGPALGSLPDSIQRVRLNNTPSGAPIKGAAPASAPEAVADAKSVSTGPVAANLDIPTGKNLKVTEFDLLVNPDFQDLDGVQIRLTGVNTKANTYDIAVRTKDREFYRQDVKLQEHVQLERNLPNGPEIVVSSIADDRVFGYLSAPQGTHRHRRHHRRR
jgi:hypothetical protein